MNQHQTQSGSSGGFEIRGLAAGPVNVTARHPAYSESRPVVAEVDPEKEPQPVRLVLTRGGRIEGRALHRDGRPFSGGRVSFYSMEPGGAGMRFETTGISPDGSFVVDHVPSGRTMLTLMAFTPASPMASGASNVLSSVASREVQVSEGETVSSDLVLRDVVIAGRITKGGQPVPAVRVDVIMIAGASVMMWAGPTAGGAAAATSGPPLLGAPTREDGSYELLVFSPGSARVQLRGPDQLYPGRNVEIPDAERYELDFELAGSAVSGIVVDRETGAPVPEAGVSVRGKDGFAGGSPSGADGRFTLTVEPGEYTLQARAPGRGTASMPLSVGEAGLSEVRVEMEPGREIAGRLVDAAGRGAGGFLVLATAADGEGGSAHTQPDGTFRIVGLTAVTHTVVGGSELAGLGFVKGVTPGGDPVTVRLQPAGQIAVRVVDATGAPVKDAYPAVDRIDGVRVRPPGASPGRRMQTADTRSTPRRAASRSRFAAEPLWHGGPSPSCRGRRRRCRSRCRRQPRPESA